MNRTSFIQRASMPVLILVLISCVAATGAISLLSWYLAHWWPAWLYVVATIAMFVVQVTCKAIVKVRARRRAATPAVQLAHGLRDIAGRYGGDLP